jgi:two-component sensor histidine kinase
MSGSEAPVDVLVVDAATERHSSYRDLLAGLARRVVTVAPGANARKLYGDGQFAAAVICLDGAGADARDDLVAISTLRDALSVPPVVVVSEQEPDLAAIGGAAASLDYVPISSVDRLLASRLSILIEIDVLKRGLARRDTQIANLESEVARLTSVAAAERLRCDALRSRASEQIHRSKNLLAILQSVARRTITDGRGIPEAREVLMGRLGTLARAYHLITNADGKGIEIGQIVDAELADVQHRVTASGPPVRLTGSVVQTFALAIHELAANALKHGALGTPDGSVAVGWTFFECGADRYLEFAWSEHGGPQPAEPPAYGFGLALVSSFAGAGGSAPDVKFGAEGLSCRMRLSQDVVVAAQE